MVPWMLEDTQRDVPHDLEVSVSAVFPSVPLLSLPHPARPVGDTEQQGDPGQPGVLRHS